MQIVITQTIEMKKKFCKYVWLGMSLLCSTSAMAGIRITEIMTNNVATVVSDQFNYDGYIEFFNDGNEVDLKGWSVTNIKEGETNWSLKLDSTHIVPPGYSLLFFGKSETSSLSAAKVQSNYLGSVGEKLSTERGTISFENEGTQIEISYPNQYPHLSYCEAGFMMPTPGAENDPLVTELSNRVAAPAFDSNAPRWSDEEISVELTCETEGAKIYYTTNGDAPTPAVGTPYTTPIELTQPTALRARAYKEGMLYSEIATGTFIVKDTFHAPQRSGERLPIVSLTANDGDIFGDSLGIYVVGTNGCLGGCYATPANYNQDWMRSANFEYILDGKVVDCQEVEIGVYGGCTRIHVAKSLKIKANKRSGKSKMAYNNFFPERSYKKYKSLALRNGGNGYSYVQPRWRDMFIQSLADGMNLDKQEAQPVSFYLNGQFYGMMILTERSGADYVYHNYGLDEDEIDLLYINKNELGTPDAYMKMIDHVSKHYNDADFYEKLDQMMEVDEYVDYQILEQFVGNTDWVTNNIKFWRKHDGGRFRWIVFDTDFGLSKATTVDKDMIKFATSEKGNEYVWVLLKSCLKNEDFRWKFLDQYLDRIEHQFSDERIDTKLDSIRDMTHLEMRATIKKAKPLGAPGDTVAYDKTIEDMRTFAKERKDYVIEQLKKEFGLGDDTIITKVRAVFPNDETPEYSFLLNKREHKEVKFNGWSYINERMKVEPKVPVGYKILRWEVNNVTVRNEDGTKYSAGSLTTVAKEGTEWKVSIYFEHDPDVTLPSNLCLNEICASNHATLDENGEAGDWIELYNGDDKEVDIAGMMLTNEGKALRCTIPSGSDATVVPAHGYKLLWADKNPALGALHLNFKLDVNASSKITLSTIYHGSEVELSHLTYAPHLTDESYGRESDGASTIKLFALCVNSEGDTTMTATPLAENGTIDCPGEVSSEDFEAAPCRNVFAEGKNIYMQGCEGCEVRVYAISGDLVAAYKPEAEVSSFELPVQGIYLVKVERECWKVVVE